MIWLDDHASVGRSRHHLANVEAGGLGCIVQVGLIVQACYLQVLELDEVAFELVVDGAQLCNVDFTRDGNVTVGRPVCIELGR